MADTAYKIERLHDPDAYLVTLNSIFDPEHIRSYYVELIDLLDDEVEPLSIIVDILETSITFTRVLLTTRTLQDLDVNPTKHKMSKGFIIVSGNKLMKASMDGFHRFGLVRHAQVVHTVEEALTVIRENGDNGHTDTRSA